MRSDRVAAKRDIVVVLGTVLFILLNLAAVGPAGRERAKRMVCLANLGQLTQAWALFAEDHGARLANGGPVGRTGYADPGTGDHEGEIPWVGVCWADYRAGEQLPVELQQQAIRAGALWPYCGDMNLYRCPCGYPGERVNYAIVDGMNGFSREGQGTKAMSGVWVKRLSEIQQPARRAVFIDEGWVTPDSFATFYASEQWWDAPPVRHNDGVTLSFADGHTEYWKWQGVDTIELGWINDRKMSLSGIEPNTPQGREDLHRLQRAVWGRLGYTPLQ